MAVVVVVETSVVTADDESPERGQMNGSVIKVTIPRTNNRRRSYNEKNTQRTLRSNTRKRKARIVARVLRDVRDRFAAQVGYEFSDV